MSGAAAPAAERLEDYPSRIREKVRYSDTDRQGHVNNVMFAAFLEAGRVDVLFGEPGLEQPGTGFVIVRTTIEYRSEINWPGMVDVGTRIETIGRSSIAFRQIMCQDGRVCATCDSVIVLMDANTRRSCELGDTARRYFEALRTAAVRPTAPRPSC